MASRTSRQAAPGGRVLGVVAPTFLTAVVGSGSALALVLTGSVTIGGLGASVTGPAGGGSAAALPGVQPPVEVSAPATPGMRASVPTPRAVPEPGADDAGPVSGPATFRRPSAPSPVGRPPEVVRASPVVRPTSAPRPSPAPDPPSVPVPTPTGGGDGDGDGGADDGADDGDDGGGSAGGGPVRGAKACGTARPAGPQRDLTRCPAPVRDRRHRDGGPQRERDDRNDRGPRRDDPKDHGTRRSG